MSPDSPAAPGLRRRRVVTVVLNYRTPDDTVQAVDSLRRSTDLDQQIVVCDNAAADDPAHADLRRRLGHGIDVLATGGNLGYAGGNNVGIRHGIRYDPAFYWILNPDTVVEPTTLEVLLQASDEIPDAGVLGPRILHPDKSRIWFDGGLVDEDTFGNTAHLHAGASVRAHPPTGPRDVAYITGASLLIRSSVVRSVGLLPEQYFLYFEETSYCRAVSLAGWRNVVVPRASMIHHKRSSGALPTRYYLYYMTRNRLHFGREQFGAEADRVLPVWRQAFLDPWRARVEGAAPHWVATFDDIVARAVRDARNGVYGPVELDAYPDPDLVPATEVSP